jgi:hypothetical protein
LSGADGAAVERAFSARTARRSESVNRGNSTVISRAPCRKCLSPQTLKKVHFVHDFARDETSYCSRWIKPVDTSTV